MIHCPSCQLAYDPTATRGPCPRCSLAAALAAAPAPENAGEYEFLAELGRGGMGLVSLARQRSLDRLVALKVIATSAAPDPAATDRLLREARAAAAIAHPHVVAVHEVGQGAAGAFIAMEYCEGGDLRARLRRGPLAPRAAAELGVKLADAVARAHDAGVLHRDLKPSNVLLTAAGEPKLCDFGLSGSVAGSSEYTRTGMVAGSPSYLAPELLAGAAPTTAVDVYGLGAILYECVTGRPPFTGESPAAVLAQIGAVEPVSPRRLNPAVPADLDTLILKCLEKSPGARYASAAALRSDLENFLAGRPLVARPVSPAGRAWRWAKRNPALAAALAVIALGTVATVLLLAKNNAGLRQALADTTRAEQQARTALSEALLAQARVVRSSGRQGQRHEALRLVRQSADFGGVTAAARTEALAALALEDWEWRQVLPPFTQLTANTRLDFTADLAEFVLPDAKMGAPEVRRVADNTVVRSLEPALDDGTPLAMVAFGAQAGWISGYYRDESQAVWGPGDKQPRWVYRPKDLDYGSLRLADDGSGWWFTGPDHRLGWHDHATGEERWLGSRGTRLYGITPSPDGRHLALVRDDRLEIWDLAGDRALWTWSGDVGMAPAQWSADGRWLVTDRYTGGAEIVVWDAASGEPVQILRQGQGRSLTLRLHPDGRRLFSHDGNGLLRIWDRWTGRELVRGAAGFNVLCVSADGKSVAVGQGYQTIGILDLASTEVVRHLTPDGPQVAIWREAVADPAGRWVAASTNQSFHLWDLAAGREVRRHSVDRDERAWLVRDPADGSLVYSGVQTGLLRVAPARPGDVLPAWDSPTRLPAKPRTMVRSISDDSQHWFIEDYQREAGFVWTRGDPAQERPLASAGDHDIAIASPDGRLVVASHARAPGAVIIAWPEDRVVTALPTRKPVWGFWSPDNRWCLLGGNDGYTVWRTGEWSRAVASLRAELNGSLYGLAAFSPDSRRVAVATGQHALAVIDTQTWQAELDFTLPGDATIDTWTWTDPGKFVVFGGPQQVMVFDTVAARAALARLGLDHDG